MIEDGIRVDKWLWRARLFKSRSQASRLCQDRKIRVDARVIAKAHHLIRPGNVLTFPKARDIRVVRVLSLGTRRGPPGEARLLYEEILSDPASQSASGAASGAAVAGGPSRTA